MSVEQLDNKTQLLKFAEESYLERTSRPVYSLVFLLPYVLFYESAVLLINLNLLQQSNVLVDTFVWLQKSLELLNIDGKLTWLAPPIVVVIFLIVLQMTSRKRWKIRFIDIIPMNVECVLLAVPLIVLSLLINNSAFVGGSQACGSFGCDESWSSVIECSAGQKQAYPPEEDTTKSENSGMIFTNIVTGIGAGIYEEFIFRLILISLLMIVFQDLMRLEKTESIIISVVLSAFLFSLHHHIDFINGQVNPDEPFRLAKFIFRSLAGIYFAAIFAVRRFGITAGVHAYYNVMAVIANALFFSS
jgi:membrane protease YdiL (CAAX protease family)